MIVKYLPVDLSGKTYELPGLVCPQCGAEIFLSQEVRNFLNSQSSNTQSSNKQSAKIPEKVADLR